MTVTFRTGGRRWPSSSSSPIRSNPALHSFHFGPCHKLYPPLHADLPKFYLDFQWASPISDPSTDGSALSLPIIIFHSLADQTRPSSKHSSNCATKLPLALESFLHCCLKWPSNIHSNANIFMEIISRIIISSPSQHIRSRDRTVNGLKSTCTNSNAQRSGWMCFRHGGEPKDLTIN